MKKTTTGLLGLGVATVLALSPLGATLALADDDTSNTAGIAATPDAGGDSGATGDAAGTTAPTSSTSTGDSTGEGADEPGTTPAPVTAPPFTPVPPLPVIPTTTPAGPSNPNQNPSVSDDDPEPAAPGAVTGLDAVYFAPSGEGDGTVTVTWNAPDFAGVPAVTNYKVELLGYDNDFHDYVIAPASQTSVDFTVPSTAGRQYTAYVSAGNGDGTDGDTAYGPTSAFDVFTPESTDFSSWSKPLDLTADYSSDGETANIHASWSTPAEAGSSPIDYYEVFLTQGAVRVGETQRVYVQRLFPVRLQRAADIYSTDFTVPVSYDTDWTVWVGAVDTTGTSGDYAQFQVFSDSSPVDPGPPTDPESPWAFGSATPFGYKNPGLHVTWRFDLPEQPSQARGFGLSGWAVIAVDDATGEVVGVTQVGPDARAADVVGGGSVDGLAQFGDEGDDPFITIEGRAGALPNSTELHLFVLPMLDGYVVPFDLIQGYGTTNGPVPPAPTEPSGDSTGGVTVSVANGVITAKIPSAAPGDWVYGFAFSTPAGLGWTQVGADGTASWSLAAANLPAGQHHLAVVGDDGALLGSAAFSIGVTPAATTAQLASTGSDAEGPLGAAALLLLAGVALVAVRRVRSVRTQG